MNLNSHLAELTLLQASLLPTEILSFLPISESTQSPWLALLGSYSTSPFANDDLITRTAHFEVHSSDSEIYLEVLMPAKYPDEDCVISVHGSPRIQESDWRERVQDAMRSVAEQGSE